MHLVHLLPALLGLDLRLHGGDLGVQLRQQLGGGGGAVLGAVLHHGAGLAEAQRLHRLGGVARLVEYMRPRGQNAPYATVIARTLPCVMDAEGRRLFHEAASGVDAATNATGPASGGGTAP